MCYISKEIMKYKLKILIWHVEIAKRLKDIRTNNVNNDKAN